MTGATTAGDLTASTRALHERMRLACAAATDAGLPGTFRAMEAGGLRAVLVTAPGLGFLNAVTGVDERSAAALPGLLAVFASAGAPAPAVVGGPATPQLDSRLADLGYRPADPGPLAVAALPSARPPAEPADHDITVRRADGGSPFLDVLLRGYGSSAEVSALLAAEHASAGVHGFLAWRGGQPVAAAGLSIHGTVAVLGGAATVPGQRGSGAQAALVRHRLRVAADAGARLAVATAAPGSPSARNLARAGFDVLLRPRWRSPGR